MERSIGDICFIYHDVFAGFKRVCVGNGAGVPARARKERKYKKKKRGGLQRDLNHATVGRSDVMKFTREGKGVRGSYSNVERKGKLQSRKTEKVVHLRKGKKRANCGEKLFDSHP